MRIFNSIRWRLQLWHALVLALVLAGFGATAWRLERETQVQRIDQELERRVAAVVDVIDREGSGTRRPPPGSYLGPGPPRGEGGRPPARIDEMFGTSRGAGFYYVAWRPTGREAARSASAPDDVPPPLPDARPRTARLRGTFREYVHVTARGDLILVGRDIRQELADIRRFAWLLAGAGAAVFLMGLAGGWLMTERALRPIQDISATASRIASGDLAQRIPVARNQGELETLARVLNDTFARLQASFARQAQFTADASHELRTPVSVVLTQTQAALSQERSGHEYRATLEACQRAARRMRRLIESLLTLARLDSGESTGAQGPCDIGQIASDATELLRPAAEARQIRMELDLAPASCRGSAEPLGQVVTNLVGNAICYTAPGGSVRVRTGLVDGAAVLSVIDSGTGIAPEDLPHVFERFYRANRARSEASSHAGLGLAIVKGIVEAHGGSVEVSSDPGKGSTFTVRFPRQA